MKVIYYHHHHLLLLRSGVVVVVIVMILEEGLEGEGLFVGVIEAVVVVVDVEE
jgi:hypothetical protein